MTPPRTLIVRRHGVEPRGRLQEKFAGLPVDVMADRRFDDRRWLRAAWPSRFPSSTFMVIPVAHANDWIAPAPGDTLVTRLAQTQAAGEHGLSLIPGPVQSRYDTYDMAVERARRFAEYAAVDLWYTEDALRFVMLGIGHVAAGSRGSGPADAPPPNRYILAPWCAFSIRTGRPTSRSGYGANRWAVGCDWCGGTRTGTCGPSATPIGRRCMQPPYGCKRR